VCYENFWKEKQSKKFILLLWWKLLIRSENNNTDSLSFSHLSWMNIFFYCPKWRYFNIFNHYTIVNIFIKFYPRQGITTSNGTEKRGEGLFSQLWGVPESRSMNRVNISSLYPSVTPFALAFQVIISLHFTWICTPDLQRSKGVLGWIML